MGDGYNRIFKTLFGRIRALYALKESQVLHMSRKTRNYLACFTQQDRLDGEMMLG